MLFGQQIAVYIFLTSQTYESNRKRSECEEDSCNASIHGRDQSSSWVCSRARRIVHLVECVLVSISYCEDSHCIHPKHTIVFLSPFILRIEQSQHHGPMDSLLAQNRMSLLVWVVTRPRDLAAKYMVSALFVCTVDLSLAQRRLTLHVHTCAWLLSMRDERYLKRLYFSRKRVSMLGLVVAQQRISSHEKIVKKMVASPD